MDIVRRTPGVVRGNPIEGLARGCRVIVRREKAGKALAFLSVRGTVIDARPIMHGDFNDYLIDVQLSQEPFTA